MTEHTCGTCTACCREGPPVPDVGKLPFRRCIHERAAIARTLIPKRQPGCAIYANRPLACQEWSCTWLTDPSWPDDLRPDRCGVICDPVVDLIKVGDQELPAAQIWVMRGQEDAWNTPEVGSIIEALTDEGLAVLWRLPTAEPTCRAFIKNAAGQISVSEPSPCTYLLGQEEKRFARAAELMNQRKLMMGVADG